MLPFQPLPNRRRGVALVIVLSILVLLTAVVIAFFINATTDLTSSKSYSDSVRTKLLAASAINVVEGQIAAATRGVDTSKSSAPLAWASQPGMVRTYDTKGQPVTAYKLYSSDSLQFSGALGATALSAEIPPDWNTHPSDFVDLNSPVLVSDPFATPDPKATPGPNGSAPTYLVRYPVVDGNNLKAGLTNPDGTINGANVYGYDVNGDGKGDIEGFSVQQPATYSPDKPVAPDNNPVPMPVRWLYQLRDGQLHARDPQSGVVTGASGSNPVVARVAFWTDDDTSKLNVNTASEGTFWDRPWAKTQTELNFSSYYPAQNEFQMFTGHPAKNCLSTVFGSLWPSPLPVTAANYSQLKPYYDLTPRVTEGSVYGSQGGTQPIPATGSSGIPYDADRLYTSLDEIIFKPSANTTDQRPARNDSANTAGGAAISPQFLETTRFFLTANNRAPEVTLLNTPRISLWPVQSQTTLQTAKDQLLAFCSTIPTSSTNYYYFQRATGTTSMVTSPAVTGLSSESMTQDANLPRNQQLYSYLQTLLSSDVPGLGGNFQQKYGAGPTAQIQAEMVEQIRSGVNTILNTNVNPVYNYTQPRGNEGEGQIVPLKEANGRGFGRFSTVVEAAVDFFRCNDPSVKATPANPNPKTADIQLGAVLVLQLFNPTPGFPTWSPKMRVEIDGLNNFTITAGNKTGINMGFPGNSVDVMNGVTGNFEGTNSSEYNGTVALFYRKSGTSFLVKNFVPNDSSSTDPTNYPFYNNQASCTFPADTSSFTFNGGTIHINIYTSPATAGASKELVQTLNITFPPSSNLPVPPFQSGDTGAAQPTAAEIFKHRLSPTSAGTDGQTVDPSSTAHGNALQGIIGQQDVVRSMVVRTDRNALGDYRVIAALNNVPADFFAPHPFYNFGAPLPSGAAGLDPNPGGSAYNWRFAHNLRTGISPGYSGLGWYDYGGANISYYIDATPKSQTSPYPPSTIGRKPGWHGNLVKNLPTTGTAPPYHPDASPAVPPGLEAATMSNGQPGDWDSGYGILEDGPYINKPDEANGQLSGTGYAAAFDLSPYFLRGAYTISNGGTTYSPNRQISSAVAFGSLPTGIDQTAGATINPWQTLLFCANPPAGTQHPGFGSLNNLDDGYPTPPYSIIPDHYILDLFTMPIVEPYAISEPLSTQGKVNMNYQIAPFTYIRRDTGLRAVLKSTWLTAVPTNASRTSPAGVYKANIVGAKFNGQLRYGINPGETKGTLKVFEDRFHGGEIFRSASEICSVPLVPQRILNMSPDYPSDNPIDPADPTIGTMSKWWDGFKLTGDNEREAPYGDLYARLTTKSNTFTVHVRVQTLKKVPGSAANTFVDPNDASVAGAKDVVTAEYRGAYQIERYVDPNATLPDYATNPNPDPISKYYKFHTIGVKEF